MSDVEHIQKPAPRSNDTGYPEVKKIKTKAISYYTKTFQDMIRVANEDQLIACACEIMNQSTAVKILPAIYKQMLVRVPKIRMKTEVFPKLILLCCISKKSNAYELLDYLIRHREDFLTPDLVNSIIEYSSHSLVENNLYSLVLEAYSELLTVEGILCALLVSVLRGNKQLFAIYQFIFTDKLPNGKYISLNQINYSLTDSMESNSAYNAPFFYVLLAVAAQSPHVINTVIPDLVLMYDEDNMSFLLVGGGIDSEKHRQFAEGTFNMACKLNNEESVIQLLDSTWVDSNLMSPIYNAVQGGNQKILRILLESLLHPDTKISLEYGAIPNIFSNPRPLKLLPIIADRFPMDASWFVDQLSGIPIPIAVPTSEGKEPLVSSEWLSGLKIGSACLSDVLFAPEVGVPHDMFWNKLNIDGQLRKISSKQKNADSENECVICMIPDMMIREPGIGQLNVKDKTNTLIRLLDIGNEQIILSPVIQALIEHHWAFNYFWVRFAVQFAAFISFIGTTSAIFCTFGGAPSIYLEVVSVFFSLCFLIQEIRQFRDNPSDYIHSFTNLLDLFIYILSATVVLVEHFLKDYSFPALIKGLVVIFSTKRLVLHLRIFPSVGPIVRITISALGNVVPILIPMAFLILAYAGAFFIAHQEIVGPETSFRDYFVSLQFTMTMMTFDYTMIQLPNAFTMFAIRLLFHATFLICFVNIIVALMTVNVADITSNMQAAYLIEISQLIIELEKFWPYPLIVNNSGSGPNRDKKIGFSSGSIAQSSGIKNIDGFRVILYNSPIGDVSSKTWWNDFPQITKREQKKHIGAVSESNPSEEPKENIHAANNSVNMPNGNIKSVPTSRKNSQVEKRQSTLKKNLALL
jgi:hypothetical protein